MARLTEKFLGTSGKQKKKKNTVTRGEAVFESAAPLLSHGKKPVKTRQSDLLLGEEFMTVRRMGR